MKKKPLISIIIVNWNGKKWLRKCLDSLVAQTYKQVEILLVDNASTDDSVVFVKKRYPKVRIITNTKNSGFATGNNIGINRAKGSYILLLNNDTWVKKDFVQKLKDFYTSHDYAVISPIEHTYTDEKSYVYYPTLDITGFPYFSGEPNSKVFYLTGVCLFFEKHMYLATRGLDNDFFMYFEEADWFWRLTLLGKKFSFAHSVNLYHAGAGATKAAIRYNLFLWRNENIPQMLIKNYSLPMLCIALPLYLVQNILEIVFFLAIGKFTIAYTYLHGWLFTVQHLSNTLIKRRWIQKHRTVSEIEVLKKMYLGPSKLVGLVQFLKNTYHLW